MTQELLTELTRLNREAELTYLQKRADGKNWRASWRARDRWMKRWDEWAVGVFLAATPDAAAAAREVEKAKAGGVLKKGLRDSELWKHMRAWVSNAISEPGGAEKAYVGLALDTGEDAGQFALDALGIDRDFAWAHPRAMGRDIFAVRGSKIIQNAYGDHIDRLTDIIIGATSPKEPKSIQEVTAEIKREWPALAQYQAKRIARTETAAVWETTNMNVMVANGVHKFDWITATGPSIGTTTEPVDDVCLKRAAKSPYTLKTLASHGGGPPEHPNCRCTLIPVLVEEDGSPWLPPQEPWTGGELSQPIPTPEIK